MGGTTWVPRARAKSGGIRKRAAPLHPPSVQHRAHLLRFHGLVEMASDILAAKQDYYRARALGANRWHCNCGKVHELPGATPSDVIADFRCSHSGAPTCAAVVGRMQGVREVAPVSTSLDGGRWLPSPAQLPHRAARLSTLVTDRYVDVFTTNNSRDATQRWPQSPPPPTALPVLPLPPPPLSPPPSPLSLLQPNDGRSTAKQHSLTELKQYPLAELKQHSLTELESDVLALLLSWVPPADLARVAICGRCMHEPIQQAADLRVGRLAASLAPFRGLARLQVPHIKEAAKEAERREQLASWHHTEQALTSEIALVDSEQFVYNEQYAVWMPASANPHEWVTQNH